MTTLEQLADIAAEAEAEDGSAPLDEATLLALRHPPERTRTWEGRDAIAVLVGDELGLVVRPSARGAGLGRSLLEEVLSDVGDATLLAWSHGDHPAAAALASGHGFTPVRELRVMRRPASLATGDLVVPPGITVRGYTPADAGDVLRVNAAAFAHHPEQGEMDADDLAERMAEPWFDPAGLLLATEGDRLLGFHWTKQHSASVGEVYVVGIAPEAQGRGLGTVLTRAGLQHLAGLGVDEVILYVESDNAAALAVYGGLGFTHAARDTHVMYRR